MDCVFIQGLEVRAHHGVTPAEQAVGCRFRVDAKLYLDLDRAARLDSLQETVDYSEACRVIFAALQSPRSSLVEHVADRIAAELFEAFPKVRRVGLRLAKLGPPSDPAVDAAGVEIERSRQD